MANFCCVFKRSNKAISNNNIFNGRENQDNVGKWSFYDFYRIPSIICHFIKHRGNQQPLTAVGVVGKHSLSNYKFGQFAEIPCL